MTTRELNREEAIDFEAGVLAWCFFEAAITIRDGDRSLCTRERMEAFQAILRVLVTARRSQHADVRLGVFPEILQRAFSDHDKHWTVVVQEKLAETQPLPKLFYVIRQLRLGKPVHPDDRKKAIELCQWASKRFKTLSSGPQYQNDCRL
jgi:hypothetical protein